MVQSEERLVLENLYKKYGFKLGKSKESNAIAFIYEDDYFDNVEIITFDENAGAQTFDYYTDAGYSCKQTQYTNIEDINNNLFKGFFSVKSNSFRLQSRYQNYCNEQSRLLGSEYVYIPCPFSIDSTSLIGKQEDGDIIGTVNSFFNEQGARLIIIEAAAGFGKTCTANEIISTLISNEKPINPIFTELSRNRTARIFRYVLLDEIDRNYHKLDSSTVKYEILSGRIPVLIDGFDELISKTTEEDDLSNAEDAESMLDTIGELLKTNAKVIITSRKTAFFAGEKFESWVNEKSNEFEFCRIGIKNPSLVEWLGKDKISKLEENNVPIDKILNPVLLTFLRNLPEADFFNICTDIETIINQYFSSLLIRENTRQNIKLIESEQKEVFFNLAFAMADENITSEHKEYLKMYILESSKELLEKSLELYGISDKPNLDELADKLTNHALLDRVGRSDFDVGFVNDFVFGTLIGQYLISKRKNDWLCSEDILDMIVAAYACRDIAVKKQLWECIKNTISYYEDSLRFRYEMTLIGSSSKNYEGLTIEEERFIDCEIGKSSNLQFCVFNKCEFKNVSFCGARLSGITFIGCTFEGCVFSNLDDSNNDFFNCSYINSEDFSDLQNIAEEEVPEDDFLEAKKLILSKFWPEGRSHAFKGRPLKVLLSSLKHSENRKTWYCLKSLKQEGVIDINDGAAFLNLDKIIFVKNLLGR